MIKNIEPIFPFPSVWVKDIEKRDGWVYPCVSAILLFPNNKLQRIKCKVRNGFASYSSHNLHQRNLPRKTIGRS